MTDQDYRISIENAVSALCKADKAADVAHVEDLAPSDYQAVFDELYLREEELKD